MTKTTPTLTIAIAKLCAVLRELGMGPYAEWIEQDAHMVSLGQAILDAGAELSSRSRQIRWERKGEDREAAIAVAIRYDMATLAGSWLNSALRAVNGFNDPADADRMAKVALEMLAWHEARKVANSSEPSAALMDQVVARLGTHAAGARVHLTIDPYGSCRVQWRRAYADGTCSDDGRNIDAATPDECLQGLLAWEDESDRQWAETGEHPIFTTPRRSP